MSDIIETYRTEWRGIGITIRFNPVLVEGDIRIGQMEVWSDDRVPLPISETGYRVCRTIELEIEEFGGPVGFALYWLDFVADRPEWKAYVETSRQLALF